MPTPEFDEAGFRWPVAKDGYQWMYAKRHPSGPGSRKDVDLQLMLTDGYPIEISRLNSRTRNPLSIDPALFRVFADLPPVESEILGFANSYGLLGGEITEHFDLEQQGEQGTVLIVKGETLAEWERESLTMKHVVNLWELMRMKNPRALTQYVKRAEAKGDPVLGPFLEKQERSQPHQSPPDAPTSEIVILMRRENDHMLAASFVRDEVDRHLSGHIDIRSGQLDLWARLEPTFNFLPDSLLSGIWLQLALAIDANKEYRQCKVCGNWFEFKSAGARPSRQYCSNACRLKAYRKRQDEARSLYMDGVGLKEIAARLGTDTKTAKGWVSKKK